MKKRLLSIALALSLVAPVCAMPTAEAYHAGTVEGAKVLDVGCTWSNDVNARGYIASDDSLWMWVGSNVSGQLGDGTMQGFKPLTKVLDDVSEVSLGTSASAAIKTDGSLWVWGRTELEQFYNESYGRRTTPVKAMENVASVSLGLGNFAVIKTDGSLWMWGRNDRGQLGKGTAEGDFTRVPVKIMDDVAAVSLGVVHSAAIKTDGTLWMWGENWAGQVGDGTTENRYSPVKVMDHVKTVALGTDQSAAIKTDGTLWTWGSGGSGSLMTGNQKKVTVPTKVMENVSSVALGDSLTAVVKTDGSLWTCGRNSHGQVGKGDYRSPQQEPVKVLSDVVAVSCGDTTATAIKKDGSVWLWGAGSHYLHGDYAKNVVPTKIEGFVAKVPGTAPQCTITLNLNGGSGTTKITCHKNGTITPSNNPSRDGYFFAGWYKDKACTKPWNFDTDKVTGNCTLFAKWEPKSTTTVTAEPSTQKVEIDGKKIILNSYVLRNDQGYPVNFVKLRDIAYLLDGTEANFNVDWRNNAIRLDARQPYTTPNGAEMTVPTVMAAPAKTSITPVLTGGVTAPLEAFLLTDKNGGGHNYFKLRDIGKVAGFNVEWDGARGIIVVTTTEDYIG